MEQGRGSLPMPHANEAVRLLAGVAVFHRPHVLRLGVWPWKPNSKMCGGRGWWSGSCANKRRTHQAATIFASVELSHHLAPVVAERFIVIVDLDRPAHPVNEFRWLNWFDEILFATKQPGFCLYFCVRTPTQTVDQDIAGPFIGPQLPHHFQTV